MDTFILGKMLLFYVWGTVSYLDDDYRVSGRFGT